MYNNIFNKGDLIESRAPFGSLIATYLIDYVLDYGYVIIDLSSGDSLTWDGLDAHYYGHKINFTVQHLVDPNPLIRKAAENYFKEIKK